MKMFARRAFAILLAAVLTIPVGCFVAPAATIVGDVVYAVSGSFNTLSFNPKNGYIAAPFSWDGVYRAQMGSMTNDAGTVYCNSADTTAVAGSINGSYFDMTTGLLNGSNMSNGEIRCWSEPWQFQSGGAYYEPLIVFKSDGTITGCDSNLDVTVNVGSEFSCNASYVNKSSYVAADILYYFDNNGPDGSTPYMSSAGKFAVVKKTSANIPLAINVPYTGIIDRIVSGTSCTIASDEFALFFVNGTYDYFPDSVVGQNVSINVQETIAASKDIMNNCIGFMQSTGYLIKDGVDHTDLYSYIGPGPLNNSTDGHSVTLSRGWTGMGIKDDGTIILMTSTGTSTMSAMANQMLALGVTTAFRMDSGGSSQMVAGDSTYYSEGTRAVTEIIAVVNTSMMGNASVKAELGELITRAEEILGEDSTNATLIEAKAAYNSTIAADQRFYIGRLIDMFSAKGMLSSLVSQVNSTDFSDYPDYKADLIQTTAREGLRLVGSASATDEQCDAVTAALSQFISGSYDAGRVSLGAAYKSSTVNSTYPDNGGKELTNGDLYDYPGGNTSDRWVGFLSETAAGSNSNGEYSEVYVDLGEEKNVTAASVSALNRTGWGISTPSKVEVLYSTDGTNFKKWMDLTATFDAADGVDQVMFYTGEGTATARYFVFRAYFSGDHIFLGEVSIYDGTTEVPAFTPVDVMNKVVDGNDPITIFTPGYATSLNSTNANLTWCNVVVCDYDATVGAYKVTQVITDRGTEKTISVPDDGFVVAYFGDATYPLTDRATVGDYAYLNGIHLSNGVLDACARITFKAPTSNVVDDYDVFFGVITAGNGIASPDDDYIRLHAGTVTVNQLKEVASSTITVKYNGRTITGSTVIKPGATVTADGVTYTVYIFGDVNLDAKTSAVDYALLKRAYMGNYEVAEGIQMKAACVSGGTQIRAIDYVMLKRYFIGTYVLP